MADCFSKKSVGFLLASGFVPFIAYSQVYMTDEQAAKTIFPGEIFTKKTVTLTPDEVKKIEENSGEKVRDATVTVWVSSKKNLVFIDQVLGKHEFITYAVGISQNKVKNIEILEYRETYGQEIGREEWRKQFVGKDASSTLKVNKDIVNISGATLSSVHVTAGVKRILQTYEVVRNSL